MINVWNYEFASAVRLISVGGNVYEGTVVCVDDKEDLCDATEDEITIETKDGRYIGFKSSEISKIEVMHP